jgi:hypothetical protein
LPCQRFHCLAWVAIFLPVVADVCGDRGGHCVFPLGTSGLVAFLLASFDSQV